MVELLLYIAVGCITGLVSGLLGIGGGTFVVPCLAFIFMRHGYPPENIMQMAAGTSLMIMVLTTQASLRAHHQEGVVLWFVYRRLWPGVIVGTISGAVLADFASTSLLVLLFGLFLLAISVRMLFHAETTTQHALPGSVTNTLVSLVVGLKSGLLGLGGGTITIPYMLHSNFSMRHAVGVASAVSLTIATVGSVSCMITGLNEVNLPAYSTGYVYWPAVIAIAIPSMLMVPFGVKLSHLLPVELLKRIFAVFLLFVGIHMLWR